METRKVTVENERYYIEALVHYTVDREGDGIDSPIMTEVEIDHIEYLVCDEDIEGVMLDFEPNDEIKELVTVEFQKL